MIPFPLIIELRLWCPVLPQFTVLHSHNTLSFSGASLTSGLSGGQTGSVYSGDLLGHFAVCGDRLSLAVSPTGLGIYTDLYRGLTAVHTHRNLDLLSTDLPGAKLFLHGSSFLQYLHISAKISPMHALRSTPSVALSCLHSAFTAPSPLFLSSLS